MRPALLVTVLLIALAGCAIPEAVSPSPGATVAPVDAAAGVDEQGVVVVIGSDEPATEAVTSALSDQGAQAEQYLVPPGIDGVAGVLDTVLPNAPDLVVVVGRGPIDGIEGVSAQWLDREFLILGAQLPEPTGNVTAVIWPGADARGSGGAGALNPTETVDALTPGLAQVRDHPGLVVDLAAGLDNG